jgi:SAM-dependent methyltransferase
MAGAGNPPTQTWDPQRYAHNARFVSDLGVPVLELLSPQKGERILDLGCGDGVLTAKLAAMGCQVVGVDGSAEQVEATKRLGVEAYVMDGERLTFDGEFDAVFSNAALHWMRDPDRVIDGVRRALRTGGRFVAEMGGHGNVQEIKTALIAGLQRRGVDGSAADPWYFPSVEEYSTRLTSAGFSVDFIALIPRPTPLPGNIAAWLETFAQNFTACLPEIERAGYVAEVQDALRPDLCDANGNWTADYIRLRFAAAKS